MDRQQAEKITETGQMERVTYNGEAVYIQRLDENHDTARVFYLTDPQEEFDVDISDLTSLTEQ